MSIPQNNCYQITVIDYQDCLHQLAACMSQQSADILRAALEHRYPVVGVVPVTQKAYRQAVSEI